MSPFLHLLALYYACDDMAIDRMLSRMEAAECVAIYQQVKLSFVQGDADRMTEGYRAFKSWERDNAALVQHLRG